MPDEEIVPTVDEPPVVLFTDQVTAVFCVPLTEAWNEKESPARILAVDGDTDTVTDEGGGGVFGFELETLPAQPARQPVRRTRKILRKVVSPSGPH